MNSPFDFFDKIYCINLPECEDRRRLVHAEFDKVGISERVAYMHAPKPIEDHHTPNFRMAGQFGVTMSQIKILGCALSEASGHVLVFEDDVCFANRWHEMLTAAISELPDDWGIFYLGSQPSKKVNQLSASLYESNYMFGAYGYAINIDALRPLFEFSMDSLTNPQIFSGIYDVILGKFTQQVVGVSAFPLIVNPVPNFSVIGNFNVNYTKHISGLWTKYSAAQSSI